MENSDGRCVGEESEIGYWCAYKKWDIRVKRERDMASDGSVPV
jgi:hypothetical protein